MVDIAHVISVTFGYTAGSQGKKVKSGKSHGKLKLESNGHPLIIGIAHIC